MPPTSLFWVTRKHGRSKHGDGVTWTSHEDKPTCSLPRMKFPRLNITPINQRDLSSLRNSSARSIFLHSVQTNRLLAVNRNGKRKKKKQCEVFVADELLKCRGEEKCRRIAFRSRRDEEHDAVGAWRYAKKRLKERCDGMWFTDGQAHVRETPPLHPVVLFLLLYEL